MFHHDDDDNDNDNEPYIIIEKRSSGIGVFLLGGLIGAGLALLLAPRSGAETRGEIRRRVGRVRRAAERVAGEVSDTVTDGFHDARRRVEEQIDSARQEIELRRQQVRRAVNAGRTAADEARIELEQRIAESKAAATDSTFATHDVPPARRARGRAAP